MKRVCSRRRIEKMSNFKKKKVPRKKTSIWALDQDHIARVKFQRAKTTMGIQQMMATSTFWDCIARIRETKTRACLTITNTQRLSKDQKIYIQVHKRLTNHTEITRRKETTMIRSFRFRTLKKQKMTKRKMKKKM